jgi:hypothetical protein
MNPYFQGFNLHNLLKVTQLILLKIKSFITSSFPIHVQVPLVNYNEGARAKSLLMEQTTIQITSLPSWTYVEPNLAYVDPSFGYSRQERVRATREHCTPLP